MTRPSLGMAVGDGDTITSELSAGVEAAARDLGLRVGSVGDPAAAAERDIVIAVGYPHYYPWLSGRLPGTLRVSWLGEPLPPADEPAVARLRRALPMGRILDVATAPGRLAGRPPSSSRLADWRERAAVDHDRRFNLSAHRRAAKDGMSLVVTSRDRQATLRRSGIDAKVVPFGYHPVHAGPMQPVDDADRDIDVLVLATDARAVPTRRARVLAEVLCDLGPGYRVEIIERATWGADRQRLLGRARVVLNVHRVPGNFTGMRTLLVGASGAVLVSEPVETPEPYIPGVHYVEAPAAGLAAAVRTALTDRSRRLAMAEALQRFLLDDLTMARSVDAVLELTA